VGNRPGWHWQVASAPLQLFAAGRVLVGMKTFLKVLLVIAVAVLAVKLLPLTLALGFALGLTLLIVGVLGVSALAVLLCVAIGLVALLSPLWIPVLALVGVLALIKKLGRNGASVAA
jgi:hypothetical protein